MFSPPSHSPLTHVLYIIFFLKSGYRGKHNPPTFQKGMHAHASNCSKHTVHATCHRSGATCRAHSWSLVLRSPIPYHAVALVSQEQLCWFFVHTMAIYGAFSWKVSKCWCLYTEGNFSTQRPSVHIKKSLLALASSIGYHVLLGNQDVAQEARTRAVQVIGMQAASILMLKAFMWICLTPLAGLRGINQFSNSNWCCHMDVCSALQYAFFWDVENKHFFSVPSLPCLEQPKKRLCRD